MTTGANWSCRATKHCLWANYQSLLTAMGCKPSPAITYNKIRATQKVKSENNGRELFDNKIIFFFILILNITSQTLVVNNTCMINSAIDSQLTIIHFHSFTHRIFWTNWHMNWKLTRAHISEIKHRLLARGAINMNNSNLFHRKDVCKLIRNYSIMLMCTRDGSSVI